MLEVSEDDPGLNEVSFAVIALDVATISEILRHMDELSKRDDVHHYLAYDYSPVWVDGDERTLWKTIRQGANEDSSRMDCEQRHTSNDDVRWSAYYKHTDVTATTSGIDRKTLEKLLAFCKGEKDEDQLDFDESETDLLNLKIIKELDDEFGKKAD